MNNATKLVQGEEFDSYTPFSEVIAKGCGLAEDICFESYKLLHSVIDTSIYKIGQKVIVDFDGDDSLKWNGEIAGIFRNDLLVYLY